MTEHCRNFRFNLKSNLERTLENIDVSVFLRWSKIAKWTIVLFSFIVNILYILIKEEMDTSSRFEIPVWFILSFDLLIPFYERRKDFLTQQLILIGLYIGFIQLDDWIPPIFSFIYASKNSDLQVDLTGFTNKIFFYLLLNISLFNLLKFKFGICLHSSNYNSIIETNDSADSIIIKWTKSSTNINEMKKLCLNNKEWSYCISNNNIILNYDIFLNIAENKNLIDLSCLLSEALCKSCFATKLVVNGSSLTVYFDTSNSTSGNCYQEANLNIFNMFKTYHHLQISKNNSYNHISNSPFPGSVPIIGYFAIMNKKNGYFRNDKKPTIKISNNYNETLPPCELKERLAFIDEKVPAKNRTTKELNNYLKYIAHLYHNKEMKTYRITEDKKVRWIKHVNWVLSSPALGPVLDKKEVVVQKIQVPDFKPIEKIYELKTITKVDYIEGETKEIKKEIEVEEPLFNFNYKIIRHEKKNIFCVEDLVTKRRMSKNIPPFCRDPNVRNPFYPNKKCIDEEQEPLKELLETGKAFYCEKTDKYHRLDGRKTKKIFYEKVKEEDQVLFEDVEIEIPVVDKTVQKYNNKKEYDLNWQQVSRKSFSKMLESKKEEIITYNRFEALKPNKKLEKKTHFKISQKYNIDDESREFCRHNRPGTSKSERNSLKSKKTIRNIRFGDIIEKQLNIGMKEKIKQTYSSRYKHYPKKKEITLDNIISGLNKGFFTKHEFPVKKCFREAAFQYLNDLCLDNNIKKKFKYRQKCTLNNDFDSDDSYIEKY